MSVAIMQPYFFPYLGYFQLVQSVDDFVFYDDVMFIKKGWINRNQILMQQNAFLFTIPLEKQSQNKSIRESNISWGPEFPTKWLQQLQSAYKKAPQFVPAMELIESVLNKKPSSIADLAASSVMATWQYLNLEKRFHFSSELGVSTDLERAERLMAITETLGSKHYINAKNGQELYQKEYFADKGFQLNFLNQSLPPYSQGNKHDFVAGLSMIDVLMWNSKQDIVTMLSAYSLI
ncbi:WbqC family protein [Aquirufa ecclesiirivi]